MEDLSPPIMDLVLPQMVSQGNAFDKAPYDHLYALIGSTKNTLLLGPSTPWVLLEHIAVIPEETAIGLLGLCGKDILCQLDASRKRSFVFALFDRRTEKPTAGVYSTVLDIIGDDVYTIRSCEGRSIAETAVANSAGLDTDVLRRLLATITCSQTPSSSPPTARLVADPSSASFKATDTAASPHPLLLHLALQGCYGSADDGAPASSTSDPMATFGFKPAPARINSAVIGALANKCRSPSGMEQDKVMVEQAAYDSIVDGPLNTHFAKQFSCTVKHPTRATHAKMASLPQWNRGKAESPGTSGSSASKPKPKLKLDRILIEQLVGSDAASQKTDECWNQIQKLFGLLPTITGESTAGKTRVDPRVIEMLLSSPLAKEFVLQTDASGQNALHYAIQCASLIAESSERERILNQLLDVGGMEAVLQVPEDGLTAVHLSVSYAEHVPKMIVDRIRDMGKDVLALVHSRGGATTGGASAGVTAKHVPVTIFQLGLSRVHHLGEPALLALVGTAANDAAFLRLLSANSALASLFAWPVVETAKATKASKSIFAAGPPKDTWTCKTCLCNDIPNSEPFCLACEAVNPDAPPQLVATKSAENDKKAAMAKSGVSVVRIDDRPSDLPARTADFKFGTGAVKLFGRDLI